jgi:adenylosuccinate lyase
MPEYDTYLSPFSWRYGSQTMRYLWSEENKRILWRRLWVALAEAEMAYGLVTPEQLEDLRIHAENLDIPRALEIETQIHHDLMAELRVFAEQALVGGGILHLGATSMDIEDNADVLRIRGSLDHILQSLAKLLAAFADRIEAYASLPLIAYTHIQPAEPSTLGYRLAFSAQDLLADFHELFRLRNGLRGKGFKGAVGTSAAYAHLIGDQEVEAFENRLSDLVGLPFFPITHQTYPRKQDYRILSALAGLAASLSKFAFDLRLLQTPAIGEAAEPFGEHQVGSSAMPFKRNPIQSEKINSLARIIAQAPRIAWDNTSLSLFERTLDDSANRRTILPESFLATDELLGVCTTLIKDLRVNEQAIARNLNRYGPFAATERVMMALVKAGADRQKMHERLRSLSMQAWEVVQQGLDNPLNELVFQDEELNRYLSPAELAVQMDFSNHTGAAQERSKKMAMEIRETIHKYPG